MKTRQLQHAIHCLSLLLGLSSLPASTHAYDFSFDGIDFTLHGFGQVVDGKIMSGNNNGTYQQWKCPCTIQNWEYVGMYQKYKGWETAPESLAGLQLTAKFTSKLSATIQEVSRATNENNRPTPDWAFLSYDATPNWTFQAGRKRIPLYYYSDYLYIGYAYPWVRPAPDVYGWPIYEYNGANVDYHTGLGNSDWTLEANYWGGHYAQSNDAYDTLLYTFYPNTSLPNGSGGAQTNEAWLQMHGAYVNLNNGIFGIRVMGEEHRDRASTLLPNGTTSPWFYDLNGNPTNDVLTRIMGVAFNVDTDHWIVRTESDRFDQPATKFIYNYYLAGAGYHWQDWTGMITQSHYITEPTPSAPIEGRRTTYFSVRWDFKPNLCLKLQYDISKDLSQKPYMFLGDSNLLSVALDGSF